MKLGRAGLLRPASPRVYPPIFFRAPAKGTRGTRKGRLFAKTAGVRARPYPSLRVRPEEAPYASDSGPNGRKMTLLNQRLEAQAFPYLKTARCGPTSGLPDLPSGPLLRPRASLLR